MQGKYQREQDRMGNLSPSAWMDCGMEKRINKEGGQLARSMCYTFKYPDSNPPGCFI